MNKITKTAVAIATQAQVPTLLISKPGAGKTAFIYELGKALQKEVVALYGSCRSPEDIGGYPLPNEKRDTITLVPAGAWQKRLIELGEGILFLDELSCLNGGMQAAVMALIHEGRAGDYLFPSGVVRIAAMNPADQAAGGFDLAAPLANRLVHIPCFTDTDAVIQGFLDNWPTTTFPILPKGWEARKKGTAVLVASFLRRFPQHVHNMPEEESKRCDPWPSPRTWWEFAIPCLAACESVNVDEQVETMLLAGAVGEGTALEYLGWQRSLDLPDPEDLLKDPKKFDLMDRQDKTFAVLNGVVAAAVSDLTAERWTNAWKILHHCAIKGHVDLAATACETLAKNRNAKLPMNPELLKPFRALLDAASKS